MNCLSFKVYLTPMKLFGTILFLLTLTFGSEAQNGESQPSKFKLKIYDYTYGISPSINLPQFGSKSAFSSDVGYGFSIFFNPYINRSKYQLILRPGFNGYFYQVPDSGYNGSSSNFTLDLGLNIPLEKMERTGAIIGYSYNRVASAITRYTGIDRSGPNEKVLNKVLKNKNSHGIYAGLSFTLSKASSIDLRYTHILNQRSELLYVDAVPHSLSLAFNINFNRFSASKSDLQKARETISQLSQDTLYFINQSCKDELPNRQLDSLLKVHYNFSAFRVLEPEEIANTRKQSNVVHFALIGSYYPGEGEPPSSGIFLLDKNLNNTDIPYPHFKRLEYDLGISKNLCINGLSNAIMLIEWMNMRLHKF